MSAIESPGKNDIDADADVENNNDKSSSPDNTGKNFFNNEIMVKSRRDDQSEAHPLPLSDQTIPMVEPAPDGPPEVVVEPRAEHPDPEIAPEVEETVFNRVIAIESQENE